MNFVELKNLESCLVDGNKTKELEKIFSSSIKSNSLFLSRIPFVETNCKKEIDEYIGLLIEPMYFYGDISGYQEIASIIRGAAYSMTPRIEEQVIIGSGSGPEFKSMQKVTTERGLCVEKPDTDVMSCFKHLAKKSISVNGRVDFIVTSSSTFDKTVFYSSAIDDGYSYMVEGANVFFNEHAGNSIYAGVWLDMDAENGVCIASPKTEVSIGRGDFGYFSRFGMLETQVQSFGNIEGHLTILNVRAHLGLTIKGSGVFRMDGF